MSSVLEILRETSKARSVPGIPGQRLNRPVVGSPFLSPVGIEVELEGDNLPAAGYLDHIRSGSGACWLVKNDGSLRNGLEYVLSQPCEADEIEYLVNELYAVLAQRSTVRLSNRCSLHVHYNANNLRVNHLTSIIALWTVFEEPLVRWWGDARYKNHFCLSSKDEDGNVEAWLNYLRTGQLPGENNLRYTALNLVALSKYGSLEFRGGGGPDSPEQATTWTKFLYRLCEYAKEQFPNPQQLAYAISERTPIYILEDICGDDFHDFFRQVVQTVPDFNHCCTESFHNVQPFIFGFPWDVWMNEINKEYVPNPFEGSGKNKKINRIDLDPRADHRVRMVPLNEIQEFARHLNNERPD
jgi:hypothetical protein